MNVWWFSKILLSLMLSDGGEANVLYGVFISGFLETSLMCVFLVIRMNSVNETCYHVSFGDLVTEWSV